MSDIDDERGLRACALWLFESGYPFDWNLGTPPPRDLIPWLTAYWNEEWGLEWKEAKRCLLAEIRGGM